MEAPRTRYARSGEHHIAYQVVADGPRDLLYVTPTPFEIDVMWMHPRPAELFSRLARFTRPVVMNRRGLGLSDPVIEPATLEEQVADVGAVLDAVGSLDAVLYAEGDGVPMAILFAASHPERVSHLVLVNGFSRIVGEDDSPSEEGEQERRLRTQLWLDHWGEGLFARQAAPDISASDPSFVEWWARMERAAASPGTAKRLMRYLRRIDVRSILPEVQAPTLVIGRERARPPLTAAQSREIAERLPGARLELVPGRDSMLPGEGMERIIELIEEFVTGERRAAVPTRSLATVVFTDVVGSTERAAELGDARWRDLLGRLATLADERLGGSGGRLVKSTGDGHLAIVDGPAAAVRAARTLSADVERLGIALRIGIHTGEVEHVEGDIAGLAVHIGARVAALAGPGEVWVSRTVKDLVVGSGIELVERGTHELKGVPGGWELFEAVGEGDDAPPL